MPDDPPLYGHSVLVTRPVHQASKLCNAIQNAGGNVVRCPAIEILPPRNIKQARLQLQQLNDLDLAIFVSVNAVESALALLAPIKLPKKLQLAAVGMSTAACLEAHGYQNIIRPTEKFDSEGLLQVAAMQDIANMHVAVVRGESGREWLVEKLEANAAKVERMAIYRRRQPADSKKLLRQALLNNEISLLSFTSNEGLTNITKMAGNLRHKIVHLPLVVLSGRNRDHAIKLGYQSEIGIAESATDNAVFDALVKLADSKRYR